MSELFLSSCIWNNAPIFCALGIIIIATTAGIEPQTTGSGIQRIELSFYELTSFLFWIFLFKLDDRKLSINLKLSHSQSSVRFRKSLCSLDKVVDGAICAQSLVQLWAYWSGHGETSPWCLFKEGHASSVAEITVRRQLWADVTMPKVLTYLRLLESHDNSLWWYQGSAIGIKSMKFWKTCLGSSSLGLAKCLVDPSSQLFPSLSWPITPPAIQRCWPPGIS